MRLTPDPAFAGARIAVVFGESGPDRSKYRFEWLRNGRPIDGATHNDLEPERFAKGDLVAVRVGVPAAYGGKEQTLTAEVRVANSPPRIESVVLATVVASGGSEVQAIVASVDPDGDTPVLEYAWSRNGAVLEHARAASLPASGLTRGDRITVAVVARDDEAASPPVTSEPFVLENHPPAFSSQPKAPRPGDAIFLYQAQALDPDGDPLRYELLSAPDGMTVGSKGEVSWLLPAGDPRRVEVPVRIRAVDPNGGEAVQAFTIPLGPGPAR